MSSKDELGDRMKAYERHETGRSFLPMLPVYARIDGRGFSKFTRGMEKPFDARMSTAMIETTKFLVKETHALIGYVQSDEISLAWKADDYRSSIFFDGKVAKMTSVLAAMATAAFNRAIRGWQPYEDRHPHFDARVLQMPLDYEVANMFLWRAQDARRNAVSSAMRFFTSHREMQGKNQAQMLARLAEVGAGFEDFPEAYRLGAWVRRVEHDVPIEGVTEPVRRSKVDVIAMPPFRYVGNRTEVIFRGAEPEHLSRLERLMSEAP